MNDNTIFTMNRANTTYWVDGNLILHWNSGEETVELSQTFGTSFDLGVVLPMLDMDVQLGLIFGLLRVKPALAWQVLFYRLRMVGGTVLIVGFTALAILYGLNAIFS